MPHNCLNEIDLIDSIHLLISSIIDTEFECRNIIETMLDEKSLIELEIIEISFKTVVEKRTNRMFNTLISDHDNESIMFFYVAEAEIIRSWMEYWADSLKSIEFAKVSDRLSKVLYDLGFGDEKRFFIKE